MLFDATYKVITRLVKDMDKYKRDAIKDSLDYLADLNIEQRLQGKDATGKEISPLLRSEAYARAKKAKGGLAPFGTPDLKDTGEFNSGQYVRYQKDRLIFDSKDKKNADLVAKYGEEIHGLTEESREQALDEQLIPTVIYEIEQQILKI